MRKKFPWIIIVGALSFACADSGPDPQIAATEFLTKATWKLKSSKGKLQSADPWQELPITDGVSTLNVPDCSKDDTFTYESDGTVVYDPGPLKCPSGATGSVDGTWKFEQGADKLTASYPGKETSTYTIVILDNSILQLEAQRGSYFVQQIFEH